MFLDPTNSATLDWQIMKLHECCPETVLAGFRIYGTSTQIPVTKHNDTAYERWCDRLREISKRYFDGKFRAVDIERGFFQLVQCGKVRLGAQILLDA